METADSSLATFVSEPLISAMPTVLVIQGFRFYFYANESSEPPHIHVDKGGATGKLWLSPIRWDYNRGFSTAQVRTINAAIRANGPMMIERWNEFFGT